MHFGTYKAEQLGRRDTGTLGQVIWEIGETWPDRRDTVLEEVTSLDA